MCEQRNSNQSAQMRKVIRVVAGQVKILSVAYNNNGTVSLAYLICLVGFYHALFTFARQYIVKDLASFELIYNIDLSFCVLGGQHQNGICIQYYNTYNNIDIRLNEWLSAPRSLHYPPIKECRSDVGPLFRAIWVHVSLHFTYVPREAISKKNRQGTVDRF